MEKIVTEELFAGGGEMGVLMRSLDWSQTLLGSVSDWAQSLKTALSIILTSRYPMFIWWGAEYANLYNDAYRPILGASKHPQFLGQSAKDCWADVWDLVGPLADSVLITGQPTWPEDLLLLIERKGYLEETYFTFSYSPIRDESGGVGGVLCAMTETTGRIIGERRLRTLQELAAKTAEARTVEEAGHIATTTLSINPHDIPFALLYRVEPDGKQACLVGTTGIEAGTVASPVQVDLFQESEPNGSGEAFRWNLSRVNRTGKAELVSNLPTKLGELSKGAGLEGATEAWVIPISQSGKVQRSGLLVLGISPRREFDDDYQGFFKLIASHVATAIANADAVEEASRWLPEEGSGEWGIGNGEDRCAPTSDAGVGTGVPPLLATLGSGVGTGVPPLLATLGSGAGTGAPPLLPSRARILLVDDNVDMRDYVRRLLSRDYEVEAVSDRLAVLDAVRRHLPDLVLIDMMMPGLDGLELLRSLRNDPATQNIPIILLFARAGEESQVEGLEAEADDYLIKPFCARELLARVKTNLELARLRREAVRYQEQLRVEAQAAQKQVSNILESITDAFVAFDREWRYTYVNEYATRLLGKKREELLGKHVWTDVFPELVGTESYEKYHRAVAEQVPIVFEKFSQPLGLWVEVNAYPSPNGLAVYFRDITHRKRAEQALRESEERFRQLAENIGTVFFMSEGFNETSPGQIAYVSPAYERIWGRSCESLYQNTRSWFEAVHPDDRERIGQALPGIAKAEFDVEFRIVRPDGEVRWVHDRVFPIYNERGEIYRTAGIVEDITERKQIEEALQQQEAQLRLITDTVPVLISFVDAQQRYRFNNRTYEEWFGHPATEVYGKPIREVLGESAYEAVLPYVEQVLAGQQITFESEIPYQEGGIRYVSATYVPQFDHQGNVEGYVGLVSDISERKQAEIALQKSEERLRLAQRAAGAGLWDWDIVADRVTWSEEYYQLYGIDPATPPSYENWIASIWEPDRERTDRASRAALKHRTNLNVEFRVFHPIEGLRWLVAIGQTFYDANGKPIRMTGIALDITDRKEAEVALSQSEEQAQLAIKVGRLGTWRYHLHTDLIELDKRMREIWGEPDDAEIIPLPSVIERIHPEDRERVAIEIGTALDPRSSGTYEIDYRIVWDDGTQRWVSANGQVQFEGEEEFRQPVGFFGTALDITAQKRAEDEWRRSEQRLQLAQQAGRIGTWEWNLLTNDVSWSDGIWTLLGIERGSITPSLESFVKFLHPDERELILQRVQIALAQGDDYYDEFRMLRQDGTICWLLSKGQVIRTQDGQAERFLGINVDITDRKQAEEALQSNAERLSLALAAAKLGDWSWDAQTDIVTFSERAAEMFGIPSGPYMTWTQMQNLLHEADRERARLQVEIAIAEPSDYDIEYRVIHADGTQRWVAAKGRAQFNATGQVLGMLGVVQDITERKQAELEIRKFVSLADNGTEFIGMCDMNFVPFYVNAAGRQMVGLNDTQQYSETPVREFFFPEDQDFIVNEFLPCVLRDGRAEVEIRFRHFKTGEALWMIYNVFYIRGENNQPLGLATVSRNITDRKRAEVALLESESRFRNIADHSPIMIWMSAPDGAGVWFNQQWCEFTGQTLEEALGSGWVAAIHPEDAQSIETTCLQAHQRHEPVRLEYRLRRQDGEYRWVFDSAVARFDDTGVYLGYIGSIIDITDRKQAEAEVQRREREFRAVVENTPDLIIRYDRFLRHLYVNPRIERALGIPPEQFIGRTGIELGLTDATSQAWDAVLEQVFVTAQDSTFEFEFPNPEGDRRSYQAYFVPELVQNGEVKTVLAVVRDVTEYKRTQEALRQSEERYRLALQAARMMTWSWDAQTDTIVRSETACDVIGLRREALQENGSQGWQLVHPDDLLRHQATVQAAIDSKGSYMGEFRIIRPDNGRVIWIEDRGKVNVDAMGHLISIEGTLFDISDRKQAQQELQQTLQTLSTLINASPLPIVVIQPNMTVQLWNPAAEQLFGWSEAEVLGQPIPIVPEEKQDECRQVREAVAKGEVFAGVETYRCKRDGATVIVSISAAPLSNEQGCLNAILLIFQDITQRQQAEEALRQSEERLRLALLVSKAGIWDWDIPHNRVTWSEHIYEFHGLTPETFGGRVEDFAQLIHPDDQARMSEAIRQALAGKASYELEFRVVQPSGAVRWLSTTGGVIFDAQGHAIRMLGATRDITERKAVEEEREKLLLSEQRAREEAEQANRIKDEFLAVLSHELRSPLNPILGWAKLLQSRTFDEQKTKHALATIERNALLQTQLIEDLLDVSRILRGKLVLNAAPVNLRSTIEAALDTVRLAADAKGIPIKQRLDPNVGQVMGESARLQQVIWNLLSNAVKFTPSGGTIEIRLEQINTDAQIQVRDTGKGITREFLPHVFEYFRQEDGTTTRKFGGLGLGLAIVRHLVELHGGTVWAESPGEGLGATFTVRLPLMPASTPTPQDNPPATPVAHLTGLRILVVDDQPDIRDIVAFILEQAGAAVSAATCAPEALNLIEQSLPDVLICDIGMPKMDGYMLMRQIRQLPAEQGGTIVAIALTAYAGEVDQQQALAAGFQQHIAKPVEPEELVRAITRLVEHPQ